MENKIETIKYALGLDLGIASVGWAVINLDDKNDPTHIVDTGVIKVQSMEDDKGNLINTKRRDNRGSRRTLRRKQHRIQRMKNLIKNEFGFDSIEDIYENCNTNIYEVKVKGLSSKLSEAELSKCLIHYCKHRGFKSNRKEGNTSSEDGKVLEAIKINNERLGDRYISELLLEELDGKSKIKNSDSYKFSFLREEYKKEIEHLLQVQIENGVIGKEFSEAAIKIWESQRDFSDGPGEGSNYAVDFANVFGKCTFVEGEYRAPRYAYSQELNTAIGKLVNLRYKADGDTEYQQLNETQIADIIELAKTKKALKYKDIAKYLKLDNLKFKGNRISRDKYIKCLKMYCELFNVTEANTNSDDFKAILLKEEHDNEVVTLKVNNAVRTVFKNNGGVELYDNLPIEYKDDIATGLTFYKTDERIRAYFLGIEGQNTAVVSQLDWENYPVIVDEIIPKLNDTLFKEAASLSLVLLRQLNEIMIKGVRYDEAMLELGYQHSVVATNAEKNKHLKSISQILDEQYPNEISNPRVIRVLNKTGNLINSVIDTYGSPYFINIEVARDINLKRGKRAILENEQLENLNKNEYIKALIIESYPEKNYSNITKYDIEKFKLFQEQEGKCAYSLEMIPEGHLLSSDYEIDHIVPYSKSKLNSFTNKTLVTKKANQEKGDRVPLEYISQKYPERVPAYRNYIESNYKMTDKKKEYYLLKSLSDVTQEMTAGSIEDTRFITKYLVKILETNLKFKDEGNTDVKRVISHKAGYVNYFKKACGITNYTHSLESLNYKKQRELVFDNVECKAKDKEIILTVLDRINETKHTSSIKLVKETDKTPEYIKRLNASIEHYHQFNHLINYDNLSGLHIEKYGSITYDIFDELENQIDDREVCNSIQGVFATLKTNINKELIKKNRDNHLHHALDAIATASLTRSTQQKLSDYDKRKDDILQALKKRESVTIKYTDWRGNVIETKITSPDEFNEIEHYFIRQYAPLPFENFRKEVTAFVYEMDMDKKKELLDDGKLRSIRPLIPVQTMKLRYGNGQDDKRISALHKETVYGVTDNMLTKRISVNDLNEKKLEKILFKDSSNIKVYEACQSWLKNKNTEYPELANGRQIKKVKIEDGDANKAINVGRGFVASENIVRIDIYKQEGDDRLFFVGQNAMSISQIEQGKEITQTLWYGQEKNHLNINSNQIEENYSKIVSLHPGDLVELEKNDNSRGLCYVLGFTSGQLQIGSPIGDFYDLHIDFGVKIEGTTQKKITVSTIKSIYKKKITIRGVVK